MTQEIQKLTDGVQRRGETTSVDMRWTQVDVTPELARETLRRNQSNRSLSPTRVASYARDMKQGNWRECPHGIVLSPDGEVLDGQHRLAAVIESGCTVRMVVCQGVPKSVQQVIDQNRPRTAQDVLRMKGYGQQRIAACARYLSLLETGEWVYRLTASETLAIIQRYERSRRWYEQAFKPKRLGPAHYFAPLLWIYDGFGADVEVFHEQFATGANLRANSPALSLRNHFLDRAHSSQMDRARAVLKTLNAVKYFIEGQPMDRLLSSIGAYKFFAARLGYRPSPDSWLLRRARKGIGNIRKRPAPGTDDYFDDDE